jgi:hypothetical protein
VKYRIEQLVQAALATLPADILPADIVRPVVDIERTRDAAHGDFATNVALQLAKPARRNPRQLAQAILDTLPSSELIERAEIAGPGFINFHLSAQAYQQELSRIFALGPTYGYNKRGAGSSTVVEFVSANPTGPLHVGHGRQAALGDALRAERRRVVPRYARAGANCAQSGPSITCVFGNHVFNDEHSVSIWGLASDARGASRAASGSESGPRFEQFPDRSPVVWRLSAWRIVHRCGKLHNPSACGRGGVPAGHGSKPTY